MTRLVIASALFALLSACSGSKHADESTPQPAAPTNGSASQTTDDAASVPAPPIEGSQPSDVPQGAIHETDEQRVAQAPPDAGVRAPVRDAAAPDAARGADAGSAPGAPADAGAPRNPSAPPGPGSAPAPGAIPPTSPR